ncbi:glycosyltransferase family 39 protein [bacterium]|nr:glycosyltransferase family 39 protein [bacterium]
MKIRPTLAVAGAVALLTGVRLALVGATDLIPDEAYYFFWSRTVAPAYWDQPGGIAFANFLIAAIFGASTFTVRLGAVILAAITTAFVYDLGRTTLGDDRRAAAAAILANVVPVFAAGSVLMLHDALLGAALAATIAFFARAILRNQPAAWYAAALAGSVALYAKLSAAILGGGLLAFFVLSRHARRSLARVEPFVAALMVAAFFAPAYLWIRAHESVTLLAVKKLASDASLSGLSRVVSFLDFAGAQALVATPIVFAFVALATWRVLRRPDVAGEGRVFLAALTAGFALYFAAQSFAAKVQGNWAAPMYIPGFILATDYAIARLDRARVRKWALGGIALAAFVTVAGFVHAVHPLPFVPAGMDPATQAHGWSELADRVETILDEHPGAAILARRYQIASELAFYVPEADVFCASHVSRGSQFDIRQDYDDLVGRDVVYVDYQGRSRKLFLHFDAWEELPPHVLGARGAAGKRLNVFFLRGFRKDGPYADYFRAPFDAALVNLRARIDEGSGR